MSVLLMTLTGCGSNEDENIPTTKKAYFVDAAVSGVSYKTTTSEGITDVDGGFSYKPTDTNITFSIGAIELGTLPFSNLADDNNVYVQDLLGVDRSDIKNKKVIKMAKFLQSLDSNLSDDIITISKDTSETIDDLNTFSELSDDNVTALIKKAGKEPLSEEKVMQHLVSTIKNKDVDFNFKPIANGSSVVTTVDILFQGIVDIYDIDSESLTFKIVSQPKNGIVEMNEDNGTYTYISKDSFIGDDVFIYKVSDGSKYSDEANVNITVSPDAIDPVFTSANSTSVKENQSLAITLVATDNKSNVTYSINNTTNFDINTTSGEVTFKTNKLPDFETKRIYTFTATATDAYNNNINQSVTINILDVDDTAPEFRFINSASVYENQTLAIILMAIDDSSVTYSISNATNMMVDPATGIVTFVNAPDFETKKIYTFIATATDTNGNSTDLSVTIKIDDLPPPVAKTQSVVVSKNSLNNAITLTSYGSNQSYIILTGPSNGTLSVGTEATRTYTPKSNYTGNDSFTFKVNDGEYDSNEVTVSIKIFEQTKKTGQTKSYNKDGDEVADNSIKDDGFYQKGVASNYTRNNSNDTVKDNITGLMWQDNKGSETFNGTVYPLDRPYLAQTASDACLNGRYSECFNTEGETAVSYCSELTLGGYNDWRLPTLTELKSIVDYTKSDPAIDTNYFKNTNDTGRDSDYSAYITITKNAYSSREVWRVNFKDGKVKYSLKQYQTYVRCVRDVN